MEELEVLWVCERRFMLVVRSRIGVVIELIVQRTVACWTLSAREGRGRVRGRGEGRVAAERDLAGLVIV